MLYLLSRNSTGSPDYITKNNCSWAFEFRLINFAVKTKTNPLKIFSCIDFLKRTISFRYTQESRESHPRIYRNRRQAFYIIRHESDSFEATRSSGEVTRAWQIMDFELSTHFNKEILAPVIALKHQWNHLKQLWTPKKSSLRTHLYQSKNRPTTRSTQN